MPRTASILIAYDTTEGQTRKIAQHVADLLAREGRTVQLHDIQKLPPHFSLAGAAAVMLGASIHMGKHSPRLAGFVRKYRSELEARPSAFFSVSLYAAGASKEHDDAVRYVEEFLQQAKWKPAMRTEFAGGLMYREYSLLKRWMMAKIAKDSGLDSDTSQNYEYTDWQAVERFAREFLASLAAAPKPKPSKDRC